MSADAILTTGTTFVRLVNITNDDGTPYDLTDAAEVIGAIVGPDGYSLEPLTMSVVHEEGGIAQIEVSAMNTASMPAPAWLECEVRLTDSGGKIQPVGKYTFRTEPGRVT